MLGLRFCARAFSSCGERGPLFIAVHGPLTIAASLVAEHRLQTPRLSNCGLRAQLSRGMWDLPRPGLEPVSPALAGGFSTTAPPGKPHFLYFLRRLPFSNSSPLHSCFGRFLVLFCFFRAFPKRKKNGFKWNKTALGPIVVRALETHGILNFKNYGRDFPGGTVVKNPPANAGDTGSIPGLGRSHMPQSN